MARRVDAGAAAAALVPLLLCVAGCGGARDSAGQTALQAERAGRASVRLGTNQGYCDGALLFGRERYAGRESEDSRWARRGAVLVSRTAPQCEMQVRRFWSAYQGCSTPLQGRESETFIFWDAQRIAAFQQYGMPEIAAAMSEGRTRWMQACPADYQAVTAAEATLRAQVPVPVPITAAAPPPTAAAAPAPAAPSPAEQQLQRAIVHMAQGQYQQALTALQALAAAAGPRPIITFNIAVCHDQLGQREEAIARYREVASDPTFGPRAQARINLLSPEPQAAPTADVTETARVEFERGLALAEAGSYQEAITAFNLSYAAVPHPRTVLNIAISYHRLGQVEAAISHYQLVVDDDRLDGAMRQTAMEAIQQLTAAASGAAPAL